MIATFIQWKVWNKTNETISKNEMIKRGYISKVHCKPIFMKRIKKQIKKQVKNVTFESTWNEIILLVSFKQPCSICRISEYKNDKRVKWIVDFIVVELFIRRKITRQHREQKNRVDISDRNARQIYRNVNAIFSNRPARAIDE